MPLNPSIISSYNPTPGVDVNALMNQRMQGMANINAMERQRQADALALEDRAAAQQEAQAQAQETATLKALLPAYTYGIQTGDAAGAGNLVPPEMRPQVQQYIDALAGKSPEEVKAALIGSLSSSPAGQEALAAIQRAQTFGVQQGQLTLAQQRFAAEQAAAGVPEPMSEYQRAQQDLAERKFAEEQAKNARIASGEEAPVQLQKGERWNPEKQRVEAVPGSQTFNKQKSVHGKDFQGAINVDRQLQDIEDAVKDVMDTSGWQKTMGTGAIMGRAPNIPVVSSVFGGYDFTRKIKNLEGAVKALGRTDASASGKLGNMAVQEWRYVADAIANLDLTNMGSADLNDQLNIIMSKAQEMRNTLRAGYEQEWGDTQFYAPLPKTTYRNRGAAGSADGTSEDPELEALVNKYLPKQ